MTIAAKYARFAEEYLVDLNATEAYVRSGGKSRGKAANVMGCRWLERADVQKAIQEGMAKRAKRTEITQDMVLRELAKIGFANICDFVKSTTKGDPYVDLSGMTREQGAALSEITIDDYVEGRGEDARDVKRIRVKMSDKRGALCDIGKHLGMFRENQGGDEAPMPTRVVIEVVDGRKQPGD